MIGFKSNQIHTISEQALPAQTRWLILTNNKIKQLPTSIGKCHRLQKAALAGNLLAELPIEMAGCHNLELLRISANRLNSLPLWLLNLPKLSWLAFSGNNFNANHEEPKPLQEIMWEEFTLEEQLGEGASGNIYKALWPSNEYHKEVAIKVFKGEVTSDGFPDDEMQATIAAGAHPNLLTLLGSISDHPHQKTGLVMELIPPSYKNLGLPPSFSSCTRDTFKEGTVFNANQILKIGLQVADAANQLHLRGLMHGDLYAHNILIDSNDHILMGDFGAACFYNLNYESALKL
jgi:serine/threonine protein kinase